jgi:hypothetical protein
MLHVVRVNWEIWTLAGVIALLGVGVALLALANMGAL